LTSALVGRSNLFGCEYRQISLNAESLYDL
jgi:hypothetical protein